MQNTNLNIIFEDTRMLVLNKQAGVSVHNPRAGDSLNDFVQEYLGVEKLYPAHRLDKETSGLIIYAKSSKWASVIQTIIAERMIEKKYIGVFKGEITEEQGIWKWALTNKPEGRGKPQGWVKFRKKAVTEWTKLRSSPYFTELELKIITGRQHQIRKHASLAKHHLVGDPRYNQPEYNEKISEAYGFNRMALHAFYLNFKIKEEVLEFTAPKPKEFDLLFNTTV